MPPLCVFMGVRAARGSAVRMALISVLLLTKKLVGVFFKLCEAVIAAKVVGLAVVLVLSRGARRVDLHPANRIDRGFTVRRGFFDGVSMIGCGRLHEPLWIFFEFRHAVLAAEVVSLTVVLMLPGSIVWVHGHAAYGVGGHVDLLCSFSIKA